MTALRAAIAPLLLTCACASPPPINKPASPDASAADSPDDSSPPDTAPRDSPPLDAASDDDTATRSDASTMDLPTVDADATADAPPPMDVARADVSSPDVAPDSIAALPALEDFSLGPYPSALTLLLNGVRAQCRALDTSRSYGHSAAQGYVLQGIARLLSVAAGRSLPGGEPTRDELVTLAFAEIDELRRASTRVRGGAPGFGLDEAWDAFGDGSTNPAFTNYAWQTGMVAGGIAEVLTYLRANPTLHRDVTAQAAAAETFLRDLVVPYSTRYTRVSASEGFFWYSFERDDAKAVHNTSALIATALHRYARLRGDATLERYHREYAELLRNRMPSTPGGGYRWNYVDDGYPASRRRPEDISHALLTLQYQRFAMDTGALPASLAPGIARTLLGQIWSGNPARMNAYVDGTTSADASWVMTRAAVIGFAAHADAPGGRPELFDYARSALVSSYLTRYAVSATTGAPAAVQVLALATLFAHRPAIYRPDSRWSCSAGPDDRRAVATGSVRFYVADWAAPTPTTTGGITLTARADTALHSNLLVDLPAGAAVPVVVSVTYRASAAGDVEQYDGTRYHPRATLPATVDEDGAPRWFRASFLLDPAVAFDYEPATPGRNVLFQFGARVSVARVEATPLR